MNSFVVFLDVWFGPMEGADMGVLEGTVDTVAVVIGVDMPVGKMNGTGSERSRRCGSLGVITIADS